MANLTIPGGRKFALAILAVLLVTVLRFAEHLGDAALVTVYLAALGVYGATNTIEAVKEIAARVKP